MGLFHTGSITRAGTFSCIFFPVILRHQSIRRWVGCTWQAFYFFSEWNFHIYSPLWEKLFLFRIFASKSKSLEGGPLLRSSLKNGYFTLLMGAISPHLGHWFFIVLMSGQGCQRTPNTFRAGRSGANKSTN